MMDLTLGLLVCVLLLFAFKNPLAVLKNPLVMLVTPLVVFVVWGLAFSPDKS